MNKIILIALIACSLSGCLKGDWQDLHECTDAEMAVYNEALYFAEFVYRDTAEALITENWQAKEKVDLGDIFTAVKAAEKVCGTIPVDPSREEVVRAEVDWYSDVLYLNTDAVGFIELEECYFDTPAEDYDLLDDEDKLQRMWPGTPANHYELKQEAMHHYLSPMYLASDLMHEGVHLHLGSSSKHEGSLEQTADLNHQWSSDSACSMSYAFDRAGVAVFTGEENHLLVLYDMIWDDQWSPEDME